MKQQPGHLSDAQIEGYVDQDFGHPDAQNTGFEAHLSECEPCLGRVLNAQRTQLGLLQGDAMNRKPYPDCPDEEMLQKLAAGICPPELTESTAQHAAHCDFCAPLLNTYLKEFSEELAPEDAAILRQTWWTGFRTANRPTSAGPVSGAQPDLSVCPGPPRLPVHHPGAHPRGNKTNAKPVRGR